MSLFFSLPGTNVVIHFHTVNRISRSHADDRFVRDDEGVGDGALLRDKVYPVLAGMCSGLEGYKMTPDVAARYAQLCEGRPENRFDTVLREKVYPILAWVQGMPRSGHTQ